MKLTKLIFLLLFVCSFLMDVSAQNRSRTASSFGSANLISDYDGSLNSIDLIIASDSHSNTEDEKNRLIDFYQEMSNTAISESDLDTMLDINADNYEVWMSVYNDVVNNHSSQDLYVLRSIIMNLKSKM